MIPLSVYLFLLIELMAVAYLDFLHKKISNNWPILNIVVFILLLFIWSGTYKFQLETFFFSFSFLIVGFILFSLKIMGAGDSKYLFTFYLLVPSLAHEDAFLCLLYSTVIIGSITLGVNLLKNMEAIKGSLRTGEISMIKKIFGKKFSYAPVILLSWIWFGVQNRGEITW